MGQNKLNSFREEKKNGFRRSKYIFRLEINLEKNLDESFNPNIYSENPKIPRKKILGIIWDTIISNQKKYLNLMKKNIELFINWIQL